MKVSGVITLTTDFGLRDPYVGVMKGVILSIAAHVQIVDLSHQIHQGSVMEAGLVLREAHRFFPAGTIHVAVVDPGVGSHRRPILVVTGESYFVGPDNGIFWPIINEVSTVEVIHLTSKSYFLPRISSTFHGRDIFAPAAAHLAHGVDPRHMGSPVTDPVEFSFPEPRQTGETLIGQVVRVDRFGNLITNIHRRLLDPFLGSNLPLIRIGPLSIAGIHRTYADGEVGEGIALIGSSEFLEIAANLAKATDLLERAPEDCVGATVEVFRSRAR
jgi:S-adenosylmethionine hydrolase